MTEKKKEKSNIIVFIKGVIIGGTMLVPGVSGGSMAMILGIYDKLITSVSSFMKHKLQSFKFLFIAAAGGLLGMFLFAGPLMKLIDRYPMPTLYFFMGAVAGGIPMIFGKSKLKKFSIRGLAYICAGCVIVAAVSLIPINSGQASTQMGIQGTLLLVVAGFIAAVALVLPGISVSYLLLVMGLYDETMKAISELYMPYLIPLGVGLLIGVILTTKILEKAMISYPQPTYLMILGFVLGSLTEVFPGIPTGPQILICIITFAAGCAGIMAISRKEKDWSDNQ